MKYEQTRHLYRDSSAGRCSYSGNSCTGIAHASCSIHRSSNRSADSSTTLLYHPPSGSQSRRRPNYRLTRTAPVHSPSQCMVAAASGYLDTQPSVLWQLVVFVDVVCISIPHPMVHDFTCTTAESYSIATQLLLHHSKWSAPPWHHCSTSDCCHCRCESTSILTKQCCGSCRCYGTMCRST